jgi:hypothetical protein
MVTKGLWHKTGGFPVETAVGAPDAAFISILLAHKELPQPIVVDPTEPLYWYRVHGETDTAMRGDGWQGPIGVVRGLLTEQWGVPAWGRAKP